MNDEKQFYHCFGCGRHGDVIDFVMAHDNLAFPEAVSKLAAQAGLEIPQQSPQEKAQTKERGRLYALLEDAAGWFHEQLAASEHRHALHYMIRRGVTAEQIRAFRLGFAPADGRPLKQYLKERGHSIEEMIAAGVMRRSNRTGRVYSPFRDRIMFPVEGRNSRVAGFGGRLLPDDMRVPERGGYTPPKYLNTSETALFHKGKMLYGAPQAMKAIGHDQPLIVVEGYTDVLACHKSGFAAVAPLGTALSGDQITQLWRMIPETQKVPVLCFDGDEAGSNAARRASEIILPLLKPRHSVRFAFLPAGEDPDTLISNHGKEAFTAVLDRAAPLDRYLWLVCTAGQHLDTPEALAGLEDDLHKAAGAINDETVRHYYRQAFDKRLHAIGSAPGLQWHFETALSFQL